MLRLLYMCPHTSQCVLILLSVLLCASSYYYICVLNVLNVSSYYYICVLIHRSPGGKHLAAVTRGDPSCGDGYWQRAAHTTLYVSSYYYVCVLIQSGGGALSGSDEGGPKLRRWILEEGCLPTDHDVWDDKPLEVLRDSSKYASKYICKFTFASNNISNIVLRDRSKYYISSVLHVTAPKKTGACAGRQRRLCLAAGVWGGS